MIKGRSTKSVRVIPCDENSQIYSWQRTNKKATYKDYAAEGKLKQYRNDKRKQ